MEMGSQVLKLVGLLGRAELMGSLQQPEEAELLSAARIFCELTKGFEQWAGWMNMFHSGKTHGVYMFLFHFLERRLGLPRLAHNLVSVPVDVC